MRVGPECPAPEASGHPELRSGEDGHHDQRKHREHDADGLGSGRFCGQQEPGAVRNDLDPKREQHKPRPPRCAALDGRPQSGGTEFSPLGATTVGRRRGVDFTSDHRD